MPSKSKTTDRFKFITERSIKADKYELTNWQSGQLRKKLPRNIYWVQIVDRGSIAWNWTLLQHYLLNGDRPEHQALVEEYIATLPKAA
jgi:hypothetical protein